MVRNKKKQMPSGDIYIEQWIIEFGRPARERFCSIDAPNDFFRIRLCCTLLDTCGMCFDRGSSKRKLDNFLVFFQVSLMNA